MRLEVHEGLNPSERDEKSVGTGRNASPADETYRGGRGREKEREPREEEEDDEKKLHTFLQEIRILLPGAQVLAGFLIAVPFQQRFKELSTSQHAVFLSTFCATMLSLACFVAPSIHHRLVSPVDHKRFIRVGTRILIAGFVPLTISTVLSVHLIVSLVMDAAAAAIGAALMAVILLIAWWWLPFVVKARRRDATRGT